MNRKIFAAIGVSDFKSYFVKYFLPIILLDVFILFIFIFAFESVFVKIIGFSVFGFILLILFSYPMIIIDNQSRNIEENLHYFITYAGALSTVNLDRKEMFADISDKLRYREIARVFKKLIYLVESIKIDFSTAAYKLSSLLKTEHFSRFLERMGIALSFNANLVKFMMDEQKALMDSYEVIYKEGLERIKLVQELYVSLVLAFGFVLATLLLMPFLTGIDSAIFLKFGIIGILFLDFMIIVFA
jgi:archaellum biogenesis protein FlaJ (TadC family)